LRKLGVTLIPATAPDFFVEDTLTAVLVRQVLVAQFEKASLVAKLKAARDRKQRDTGKRCGGRRRTYMERDPALVTAVKALSAERPRLSLREIAARLAEQGHTHKGKPYPAMSVRNMLAA
jgi:hypothetical protein